MANAIIFQPAPDISASALAVDYSAGILTADGFADSYSSDISGTLTAYPIADGSFSLTAFIDNLGIASGGSLTIRGCISDVPGGPGCPAPDHLLLGGTLQYFSFDPYWGGDLIFGFAALIGDVAPDFGIRMAYVKMKLGDFPGTFNDGFVSIDFSNVADTATAVPEPSTWLLWGSALPLLWRARRRFLPGA